jgi:hypothetical protein
MFKKYLLAIVLSLPLFSAASHAAVVCSISESMNDRTHYVVELDGAVVSPGSDIRTAVELVKAYDSQGSCSQVSESVPKELSATCAGWNCSGHSHCAYPCDCDGLNCRL